MFSIYKITNSESGKVYVGITKNKLESRLKQHFRAARNSGDLVLQRAINKYGEGCFSIKKIDSAKNESEAFYKESKYIEIMGSFAPGGYNMTKGGDGVVDPCVETLKKRTIKAIQNYADPEIKERHRNGVQRYWGSDLSDAHRALLSRVHKGKTMPAHVMKAAAEAKKNPQYLKKLSARAAAQWSDSGARERLSKTKISLHAETATKFPYCIDDGILYTSTRSAARGMRLKGHDKASNNNIAMCCNGKSKTSYGRRWAWMERAEAKSKGLEPKHVPK